MKEAIQKVLNEMQPAFERHGGSVSLVNVDQSTGVVQVRFQGACQGCPLSNLTLKAGIEVTLKEKVPAVKRVVAVD